METTIPVEVASFASVPHRLVMWYRVHQRQLPWRESRDAYHVLVSETMLQQTRVETVIPYYHRFLEAFPTIHDLAQAEETEVMKRWQGLGYYSRARNLHKAAKSLDWEHGGQVPANRDAVANLPGVGPYTLGAVMSIAFDQPIPAVDGNVLRVVSRHQGIETSIQKSPAKNQITEMVSQWVAKERPSDVTQALMELGATLCTPKNASCLVCPIAKDCYARETGRVSELPVKDPKKARRSKWIGALYLEVDGIILMEKRADEGLLQGMWQLPSVELDAPPSSADMLSQVLLEKLMAVLQLEKLAELVEPWYVKCTEENHIFTHVDWHIDVYQPAPLSTLTKSLWQFTQHHSVRESGLARKAPALQLEWIPKFDIHQLVLSRVYEKIFESLLGERVR